MNYSAVNKEYDVSVIIPCFNCEKTIERAVLSAINQDVTIEIILVDDFSDDSTRDVISRLANKFNSIRVVFNKRNMGPGFSRNRGIDIAQGRYIAFLDSDDVWLPGKLKQQVAFMEIEKIDFSYHDYYELTVSEGEVLSARIVTAPDVAELPGYYYKRGFGMCLTSVISRSRLARIRFPEDRSLSTEDYFFFLLLLSSGVRGTRLKVPLGVYMVLQTSRSSNKLRQAGSVLRSNLRAANGTVWAAYYYFCRYALAQVLARRRSEKGELHQAEIDRLSSIISVSFDLPPVARSAGTPLSIDKDAEQIF